MVHRDCYCYAACAAGLVVTTPCSTTESSPWCLVFGKVKLPRRDYVTVVAVVAILVGILVVGGIVYTYKNRPALVEAAQRALNIPQIFQDAFR
jgi:hypothetical protein